MDMYKRKAVDISNVTCCFQFDPAGNGHVQAQGSGH